MTSFLENCDRYSIFRPWVYSTIQERQRAMIGLLTSRLGKPLNLLKCLEIGCGNGDNLLELIRMGFAPQNIVGNELSPDRAALARSRLPVSTAIIAGDAAKMTFDVGSFDIILQFTVFTSLLDDSVQKKIASLMLSWCAVGGGVLWYDFIYSNPANSNVRGMPFKHVKGLFPGCKFNVRRVTLAPPISRRVCSVNVKLYHIFNMFRFLRTHLLCLICKTA